MIFLLHQENLQEIEGLMLYTIYVFLALPLYPESESEINVIQAPISVVLAALHILLLSARVYLRFQARKAAGKRPFNIREMGGASILFGTSLWKARLM